MRTLSAAAALVVVLLCLAWLSGDVTPAHAQQVVITKTVGLAPAGCATTQAITTTVGTSVYYCFTIHNTSQVSFTNYVYRDLVLGNVFTSTGPFPPGGILERTSAFYGDLGPVRHVTSVTNTVLLTATIQGGGVATAQSSARVNLVPPEPFNASVLITKTVGLAPNVCATGNQLVIDRGQPVYYCLTVTNNGNVPFTQYEYNDAQLGISGATTTWIFWPGNVITRTHTILPRLGPVTPTVSITNTVTVAASGPYGVADDFDRSYVTVIQPTPAPAIVVTKTVGLVSGACATSSSILIPPLLPVFFCISVQNTGNVDLTRIVLRDVMPKDPPLIAYITVTTVLAPGEVLTLINTTEPGETDFLGNIVAIADFTNLVEAEATGPSGSANGSAVAFVDVFPARENKTYLPTVVR